MQLDENQRAFGAYLGCMRTPDWVADISARGIKPVLVTKRALKY